MYKQYWYFSDNGFRFHYSVCNGYHDTLMMFFDISNTTILDIHGVDYRCIIVGASKGEVKHLLKKC